MIAPMAASRQAIVRNTWKLIENRDSSPVRATHLVPDDRVRWGHPGAASSAASAASDRVVSIVSSVTPPVRSMP